MKLPELYVPMSDVLESVAMPDAVRELIDPISDAVSYGKLFSAGNLSAGSFVFEAALVSDIFLGIPFQEHLGIVISAGSIEIRGSYCQSCFDVYLGLGNLRLRFPRSWLQPVIQTADGKLMADPDPNHFVEVPLNFGAHINEKLEIKPVWPDGLQHSISLPKTMIGTSGVIIEANDLLLRFSKDIALPGNEHGLSDDWEGIYIGAASVFLPEMPYIPNNIFIQNCFIDSSGFTGTLSVESSLTWDNDQKEFTDGIAGKLFGFEIGLQKILIAFRQNALTECDIAGDLFVPYLDKRIGVSLGLDGAGGLTIAASLPRSTPLETGVSSGKTGYLLHLDVGSSQNPFLSLDVDGLRFEKPAGRKPLVEISGAAKINVPGLDAPPVAFKALRIDGDGNVAVDGGWLDLASAKIAPFHGFPLEITKIGFGSEGKSRRWIGLNGGIKMADGLPVGASVEGLRISWDPQARDLDIKVSLNGIGIAFSIPHTLTFAGTVAFFNNEKGTGFRGSVDLFLESLKLKVDAQLVTGRTQDGSTYFYLYLLADLPAGIPIFNTGAAFYGFAGLIATNMAPTRQEDKDWYYDWYMAPPEPGVHQVEKWRPKSGAFAGGIGVSIGTAFDDGFAFSAKALLVLVLPGPQFLLAGKGSFLTKRAGVTDPNSQGNFDALMVFDFPAKLFQANLTAAYEKAKLIEIHAPAEAKFSWAPSPPPDVWHVYLGQKDPPSKRVSADLFKVQHGESYFQLHRTGLELGAWIGLRYKFGKGKVKAWYEVSMSGEGAVSWDPQCYKGKLHMVGSAGISAYGVGIHVSIDSAVEVSGPEPWFFEMSLSLSIKVDLWIRTFKYTADFSMSWGNRELPIPQPVRPLLLRAAAAHLRTDNAVDLENAIIPPDARPILTFRRPVADWAAIGTPNAPMPKPDVVSTRKLSYQLVHLALFRTDGEQKVVAASGILNASNGSISLLGDAGQIPDLTKAAGGSFRILGDPSGQEWYTVAASGAGTLRLAPSIPDGTYAYRFTQKRSTSVIHIASVSNDPDRLTKVVLRPQPKPEASLSDCVGGVLEQNGQQWSIVGVTDDRQTVYLLAKAQLPNPNTTATAYGPASAILEGQWLPVNDRESAEDAAPSTKLMIGARTPFVWFRHNDSETTRGFQRNNPDYACGPNPKEEFQCIPLEESWGAIAHPTNKRLAACCATGDPKLLPRVSSGRKIPPQLPPISKGHVITTGQLTFTFDPVVEKVRLRYRPGDSASGSVEAIFLSAVVAKADLTKDKTEVLLEAQAIDRLIISAQQLTIESVCVIPGWICKIFDAATFPQTSTGTVHYADLVIETTGMMSVAESKLLVEAPKNSRGFTRAIQTNRLEYATCRNDLVPGASQASWSRLGTWRNRSVKQIPRVVIRDLQQPTNTYLPGIGPVVAVPPSLLRAGEIKSTTGAKSGNPRAVRLSDLQQVQVGGINAETLAAVAILLPQPATRVQVRLGSNAEVIAFEGTREVGRQSGNDGIDVQIIATTSAIDRILIIAPKSVLVSRVCYDGGEYGWQQVEQEAWQQSLNRSIEWLYGEEMLLPSGSYRIEHTTAVSITDASDESDANPLNGAFPGNEWKKESIDFIVGSPPGLQPVVGASTAQMYEGRLSDLAPYVRSTLPMPGQRPVYRAYDVGVQFNVSYLDRMFLAARQPLSIAVVDSNGRNLRTGERNWSGQGTELLLSHEEEEWIATINGSGTSRCVASIDPGKIKRDETLYIGDGKLLAPAELHAGELRAGTLEKSLYRFEFVTSRFADFVHHAASFNGLCREVKARASSGLDFNLLRQIVSADAKLNERRGEYDKALERANQKGATQDDFDRLDAARTELSKARETLRTARVSAFEHIWSEYFGAPRPDPPRVAGVEIIRAMPSTAPDGKQNPVILIIESEEPLPWDRILPTVERAKTIPLRNRIIDFDRTTFGTPDQNTTFDYKGIRWTTDAELRVVDGAVESRIAANWSITIFLRNAIAVSVTVQVAIGGRADLHGEGDSVAADVSYVSSESDKRETLHISGRRIQLLKLSGSGIRLFSVSVIEPFSPVSNGRTACILNATLPQSSTDTQHKVEITSFMNLDLSGWVIRWFDAHDPKKAGYYYTFAKNIKLLESRIARVYGDKDAVEPESGVDVYAGKMDGALPATGVIFQLLDPAENVMDEKAFMTDFSEVERTSFVLTVSEDSTRAALVPTLSAPQVFTEGYWQIRLKMFRDFGSDMPVLSVGGNRSNEEAIWNFLLNQTNTSLDKKRGG